MKFIGLALTLLLVACAGQVGRPGARLDPSFEVEPYVLRDASGLWVVWQPAPRAGVVEGELELFQRGEHTEVVRAKQHGDLLKVQLPADCGESGLAYRVTGMSAPQSFHVPPCREADRVEFAFITDTQLYVDVVHQLSGQVSKTADFVLHGGDIVQRGGADDHWKGYHAAARPFGRRIATASTVGNHERFWDDDYSRFRAHFTDGAPETWYTFSSGPVDVVVLNSEDIEDAEINDPQLAWLERTLAGLAARPDASARWRVVVTHHAPFSSSLANAWFVPIGRSRQMREEYVPLFEEHGVDLVLAGHAHIFERSRRGGVEYIVGGPAGGLMGLPGADNPASIVRARDRTLSHLEMDAQTLTVRTHDVDGDQIDCVRLRRTDDRPGGQPEDC